MKPRPERERRSRRRGHPLRAVVVAAWAIGAFVALVAAYGPFWRDVGYWMERAMAHAEVREWPEALANVGRALDGAPDDPAILTFAGHVHRELEQWPEAAGRFEQALDVDAGRPEAALGLAEARLELDEVEPALTALRSMRVEDATADQRSRAAALADEAGRPDVALEVLETMADPGTRLERARLARAAGFHEREVALLEEELARGGAGGEMGAEPGLGAPDAAAADTARADLRAAYARALRDAGRDADAMEVLAGLDRAGVLDADDALSYGWMLNERGRHVEALAVLEGALERQDLAASGAGSAGGEDLEQAEGRRLQALRDLRALAARSALWADRLERARMHAAALEDVTGSDAGTGAVTGAGAGAGPGAASSSGLSADPELRGMLAAAEARRARMAEEAEAARLRKMPPADPAAALEFWRIRLAENPEGAGAQAEVVALLEAGQRFDEARDVLVAGASLEDAAREGGPRAVHAARLSLWSGKPADAVTLLAPSGGPAELLARALLETGDAEGAYRVLASAEGRPTSAESLLLRARVADAADRPAEAADHLAALDRTRALTPDEQEWWAGLLWRSGGFEGALAGYQGLADLRPEDPDVHRAMGDLRAALGDHAGAEDSYREALRLTGPGDPAGRGLALALLRQGETDSAVAAYRAHLDAAPEDAEARLALARALAGAGAFGEAAQAYERYVEDAESTDTLELDASARLAGEIAVTWMAAGDHERAEPWARRAARGTASGPAGVGSDAPAVLLARAKHAHILALLGRHAEADAVVDALVHDLSEAGRSAEHGPAISQSDLQLNLVDAWVSRLRNRPLAALDALRGRTLRSDVPPSESLSGAIDFEVLPYDGSVFQAEVAEARGDVRAARQHLAEARDAGARDNDVQHVEEALSARARPVAQGGLTHGDDARELGVTTVWGRVRVRPASGTWPGLSGEVRHRTASQLAASGSGTAVILGADSLFVRPALRLDARLGLESVEGGDTRLLGSLGGELENKDALRMTFEASHVPVWSEARDRGAPDYGRVRQLASLDPALMVTEGRIGVGTTPASPLHRSVYAEVGAARYSDGNHRVFGYGQWSFPLHADAERTFGLTPNLYVEAFDTQAPSYASPSSFLAVGLAGEGAAQAGAVTFDGRLNPHVYRLPGDTGLGLDARLGLGLAGEVGRVRIEGRYLKQGGLYDLFRVGTEVSLPLGGRR